MREFEIKRNKIYIPIYQTKQWLLDKENYRHSPELYAVWNLKHYLLEKISNLNSYNSKFFIYTDSGAWRERIFTNWPCEEFISDLIQKLDNRILYGQVGVTHNSKFFPDLDLIQGRFLKYINFLGSSS